ncbi:MAG TPA: outer membrane protein assembly factor BamB [Steroidobacteraceae bacterium]|jgi:outer membrane protein assembly factor BamB|nr:outer membrane protein assembly factor BamB [Steroidobacteraceae bacterium]
MRSTRSALASACAAALLLLVAACDKDEEADPPAELVDLVPGIAVSKLWDANVGGDAETLRLALGLALDGGTLYAASREGEIEAFDPATGKTRWTAETKAELSAGPGVGGTLVVVGTNDGDVIAFDTAGKRLWKTDVSGEVLASPLVTGGRVIVRTVDGRLRSLDAATGKEQWSAEEPVPRLSLRGTAPPVLAGETVLAGFDSGKVMAFALASGDPLWQSQVSTPRGRSELERLADVDSAVHTEGTDGYAVGYQGRLVMFALDSGQVWWGRELSSYRGLALDADQLYVATADGSVVALRRRDGTVLWQQDGLKRRGLGTPAVVGNAVVVGDFEGYLHWLDRDTGKFVAREHPGKARISAAPVVDGERVFVIDEGGRIVAYRSGGTPGR